MGSARGWKKGKKMDVSKIVSVCRHNRGVFMPWKTTTYGDNAENTGFQGIEA